MIGSSSRAVVADSTTLDDLAITDMTTSPMIEGIADRERRVIRIYSKVLSKGVHKGLRIDALVVFIQIHVVVFQIILSVYVLCMKR
mmetsp:Transcript_26170/g.37204  ORF Transcript_26170/g.37204 Transcript_26170/m.37204 type:complete len:86 (+) Transcript_26170:71-328(+)